MLIFKQKLPMDTIMPIKVALPFSSSAIAKKSILKLDLQYDYPVMWYQADYETVELGGSDSAEPVSKEYIIAAIGTGHDWGDTLTQDHYIGTVMICGGSIYKTISHPKSISYRLRKIAFEPWFQDVIMVCGKQSVYIPIRARFKLSKIENIIGTKSHNRHLDAVG